MPSLHLPQKPLTGAVAMLAVRTWLCTALLSLLVANLGACRSTGSDGPLEPGAGSAAGAGGGTSANTTGVSGTTSAGPSAGSGDATSAGYRFIGRIPADSNTLSWSGSAVELAFSGTSGDLQFTGLNGNNYIGLSVDGGNITRTPIHDTKSASIAFGPLDGGNHTVRATKLNEGRLGQLVFNGFSVDGAALSANTTGRRMVFVGDSITVAYGIDGTDPCKNDASLEDASQSFATQAAALLTSDAALIAVAGKGMIRNDITDASAAPIVMPNYWTRYIATDANSLYPFAAADAPQLVVIALGTNDYEYTGNPAAANPNRAPLDSNAFVAGYVSFMQNVLTQYPQVKFVLCSSPMLSDTYPSAADKQHTSLLNNLNTVAGHFDPSTVAVHDFPALSSAQATGCGGHPNLAAHQSMATSLAATTKQLMNW